MLRGVAGDVHAWSRSIAVRRSTRSSAAPSRCSDRSSSAAIEVAAPILLALVITDIGFGMVAKVVPQLNVFAVGFPVKVGVGMIVVMASLPFLGGWVTSQLRNVRRHRPALAPRRLSDGAPMANDDKTEKPTPKHRSEARKRGQVAKSPDLNGAGVLFAGFIAVMHDVVEARQRRRRPDGADVRAHRPPRAGHLSGAGLNGLFDEVLEHLLQHRRPDRRRSAWRGAPAVQRRPERVEALAPAQSSRASRRLNPDQRLQERRSARRACSRSPSRSRRSRSSAPSSRSRCSRTSRTSAPASEPRQRARPSDEHRRQRASRSAPRSPTC